MKVNYLEFKSKSLYNTTISEILVNGLYNSTSINSREFEDIREIYVISFNLTERYFESQLYNDELTRVSTFLTRRILLDILHACNSVKSKLDILLESYSSWIRELRVNFFVGDGRCDAFPYIDNDSVHINIALENIVENKYYHQIIEELLLHELFHVIRIKNFRFSGNYLGELLVEEGLACLFSGKLMDDEIQFQSKILKDINKNNPSLPQKCLNKCVKSFDLDDFTIVNQILYTGNKEFNPGTCYKVGYTLLFHIYDSHNLTVYDLIHFDNIWFIKKIKESYEAIQ